MRVLAVLLSVSACAGATVRPQGGPQAVAFVGVNLRSMRDDGALAQQTVVVTGDRITAVGPKESLSLPEGTTIVDGAGKWLVPGFADMHVHLPADEAEARRILNLSLASGVTFVRSMQGKPSHLAMRRRFEASGEAPELLLGGPPIDSSLSPEQARALVRDQQAAGWDFVKILGGLDRTSYEALADEARQHAFPFVGHLPDGISVDAALRAGQGSIEHLMGYRQLAADPEALGAAAAATVRAQVWNCPTLDFAHNALVGPREDALHQRAESYFSGADKEARKAQGPPPANGAARYELYEKAARALAEAGAPLLVGSDSPEPTILPGLGFAEEMSELVSAGVAPAAVLRAATQSAAAFLHRPDQGTIAVGNRADLVLLDADPLANLAQTAFPAGVMVRGKWLAREALAALRAKP